MKLAPVSADLLVKAALLLGGAALVAYAVRAAKDAAAAAGNAAWGAVTGAADVAYQTGVGAVYGIGDAVGIPRTNMAACQQAMAEGRTWDASFACPAQDFLSYLFKPSPPSGQTTVPSGWDVTPYGPDGPRYNNPSAYVAPGYTGNGGAAFGIYPRP